MPGIINNEFGKVTISEDIVANNYGVARLPASIYRSLTSAQIWLIDNIVVDKRRDMYHLDQHCRQQGSLAKVARSKADVGSPEVQVSILTERIKEVTEHVKNNKHDFMAKRGLMQMVGKRKKLLKYLEETDFELYKKTVKKLGLRK